jgi:NDP-sugar pyrophosphorylase family protein
MSSALKALILAGGRGTRLRSLGEALPKCLLPIFDRPLLLRQIEQCALAGVDEVLVSVAARFAPMVSAVLERLDLPVKVTCLPEATPLGPVGGLLSVLSTLDDCRVLLILGDEYFQDMSALKDVAQAPLSGPEDLVLGIVTGSQPGQIFCNAVLDEGGGRVQRLVEKPAPWEIVGDARWCGVAAFPARALRDTSIRGGAHIGEALDSLIGESRPALPVRIREVHLNLNTPDDALVASLIESCASAPQRTAESVLAHLRALIVRALPQEHQGRCPSS